MDALLLAAHDGRVVEVDHCRACRLVWFDQLESVQLAGLGWIHLLRELQQGMGLALPAARPEGLSCPHCSAGLKTVLNRSRYGEFTAQECPQGHGHVHSHVGVMAERGLVRPLGPADRAAIRHGHLTWECLNCGAPAEGEATACRFCESPLLLLDLPRLAHALTRRPQCDALAPKQGAHPLAWSCVACGAALDPNREHTCGYCGQGAWAPSWLNLNALLDEAEAQVRDAETERRLLAARHRAQLLERPRRVRDWRDTQLARVHRFLKDEEKPELNPWLGLGLLLLVLLWSRW